MRWRLTSPASRLFTQSFIQADITENIKAPRHWPLCGDFFTCDTPPPPPPPTTTTTTTTTSASHMRQRIESVFVQIMAFFAYSAPSHYLNQCWIIVNWTLMDTLQWNFNQDTKMFRRENASENIVCEMAAILSTGRWINCPVASD